MIVKMNFNEKRKRKRTSTIVYQKNKEITTLIEENEALTHKNVNLTKKIKTTQRTVQRYKKKQSNISNPVKKAHNLMRESGVSPRKAPSLAEAVVERNVLIEGIHGLQAKEKTVVTEKILKSLRVKKTRKISTMAKTFEGSTGEALLYTSQSLQTCYFTKK